MIEVTRELEELGDALDFAGSGGGPLIALPVQARRHYWGTCNAAGVHVFDQEPTHYDRACEVPGEVGALSLGELQALVFEGPDETAFHALPDGGMFIRWVGADSAPALLAAALSDELEPEVLDETFTAPGGEVWLADSANDFRIERFEEGLCRFELAAGQYEIEVASWDGEVRRGGAIEETMLQVVRLRRLR